MILTVASVRSLRVFEERFTWPVDDAEKAALFRAVNDACLDVFLREDDPVRERILRAFLGTFTAVCFNVAYNGMVVARLPDVAAARAQFTPSPIDYLSWLLVGGALEHQIVRRRIAKYANPRHWAHASLGRIRHPLRGTSDLLLTVNPTVAGYLRRQGITASPTALAEWLGPWPRPRRTAAAMAIAAHLVDSVWGRIGRTVGDERVVRWLRQFTEDGAAVLVGVLDGLLRHPLARSTRRLFTATHGYEGTRVIALAVLANGGTVHAFPHTGGLSYIVPSTWMIETLTCSTFYCYTPDELSMRAEQLRVLGVAKTSATLEVLPQGGVTASYGSAARAIRRATVLSGSYLGDRVYFDVLPDVPRLRHEIALIDALRAEGVHVTVKLHRKTSLLSHQRALLKERYGEAVVVLDTPFSELIASGYTTDVYVFENIGGSFIEAAKTATPMILVCPHAHVLSPMVRPAIERRVAIIPCASGAQGTVTFDRAALHRVLATSTVPADSEFVHRFTNDLFVY